MELPGRHFHEHASFASPHDIMNDPAYDTNRRGKEREHEEPDTCRICRGEATEQDQLYYPCKCSGSIKFVHQPCLVQWLAHSQKKHCELCKTPFHFTKVYDPDMPDNLPAFLFTKQLLIHILRKVLRWMRWVLVAFVWLGWLPWSMRAIWRALFWLADGRWSSGEAVQQVSYYTPNISASIDNAALATSSVEAAQPSSIEGQTSSMFGLSSGEPFLLKLMKKAFSTLFFPAMSSSFGSTVSSNITIAPYKRRRSWLSDVKFLKSLTPSPTINNILIDTLEGQLITLLVVVSFILVFLIREWVVQQQPLDNIAEGEREAADLLIANNRPAPQAEAPEPERHQDLPAEDVPEHQEQYQEQYQEQHQELDIPAEEVAEDRGRLPRPGPELRLPDREVMGFEGPGGLRNLLAEGPVTPPIRRNLDNDGFNFDFPASQRIPRINQQRPPVNMELLRELYAHTHGDLDEMQRTVREEPRYEELGWHVNSLPRQFQWQDGPPRTRNRAQTSSGPSGLSSSTNANSESVNEGRPAFVGHLESVSQSRSELDLTAADTPGLNPYFDFPSDANTIPNAEIEDGEPGPSTNHERLTDDVDDNTTNSVMTVADSETVDDVQPSSGTSQPVAEPPRGLTKKVLDWFWADVIPNELNQDLQLDEGDDLVAEPVIELPPAPGRNNDNIMDADGGLPDDAAFPGLGLDPNDFDAIEEADDLEGLLELIGMQGPIFGLLQNGVFCALLISVTVAAGIWLPYLTGKIALVLLANPVQFILGVPMTAISVFADVILDSLIGGLGYTMYWSSFVGKVVLSPFGYLVPMTDWTKSASLSLIDASSQRLSSVVNTFFVFHEADVPMFSLLSHQALKLHEARIASLVRTVFLLSKFLVHDLPLRIASFEASKIFSFAFDTSSIGNLLSFVQSQVYDSAQDIYSRVLSNSTTWVNPSVSGLVPGNGTIDYNLAVWGTKDRTIAILMGYLLASAAGLAYLRVARLITGTDRGQRVEGMVAEGLHQAGGVMKVIVIIGIEMIVFPLYCGSLLDLAMLPIFEHATVASRMAFMNSYPLTSLFVHWFIGTCYMFHFALFVSMCRKVMRSGVLYFIRDPDDPTFHPVRDVLERNITTQLRKIAFSALVYGALVIVCLGGVVWGMYYAFDGVLPAHWSSKDPVLEFPIDLLFYNFGIPLAIQAFKPSDGLHSLYSWWFRRCARFLRLSDFFFGERNLDEEGTNTQPTWYSLLLGIKGQHPIVDDKNADAHSKRNGRFVRAPASDQVRIPKGSPVFLEVSETNERIDGDIDSDLGLHGRQNDNFTKVYIPPFFRTRIAAFLILIWIFAAATGVGTTIVPLVIGRKIMSSHVSSQPVNDVYAFSVGMGVVCAAACVLVAFRACFGLMKDRMGTYLRSPWEAIRGVANVLAAAIQFLYIAVSFAVFLPSIFALAIELYVLVPIHTYLGHEQAPVIHFVQDWTLGVLYVQLAAKLALWYSRSRPAAAINGVFQDGWLKPNVKLATRALLLPVTLLALVAVILPLSFGFVLNSTMFFSRPELQPKVYRYAYPVTLMISLVVCLAYLVRRRVENWKVNIRDEFYLIGERLHNVREKRAREVGVSRRVITG
ncbi:hypothetical protein BDW59DRAFT_93217 [Aspergillus cavernicola]|uniref:RING-type E3 ubiquitin transferase n=1 Tax=Aspergillus cavernicola TaxID=176166 RepID=A0ABR4IYI5_9EURO